ncbi:type II toxin-antitoxin system PemK/MazF family toxin [Bacillus sp. ISL-47]|uniref:type II toxin-antitoxin system PemK/MazF family toxin n=1 Tax=Bacillus sp. ISL-47 TaxID=2819130 RepID=UPI001BE5917A|nr:type II toxin-antitoxin system PemK/MazF family toxin [Bacillus sp. ISL-47]MBT2687778.1 type II toxin-antitoxin system PemK/MazF family toxin [Bacillus sp. ISL-47]MBT2709120.1 type II toxin-antitoxin system PemK/MazF family toxin [Pseudomonas sp. ISL-84]
MSAPDRGDLVYVNFNPQTGHEQAGNRPGIVLSPKNFNEATGFAAVCPITNTIRGWGYEVKLPEGLAFQGVILTDQVKSLDWQARNLRVRGHAPEEIVSDCLAKIHTFL